MKTLFKSMFTALLALALTGPAAFAQDRPAFRQQDLDQMLAPIALYPDPLLSQILMAATYPVEVVQAARWSRANAHLTGDDAVHAVEAMDWDPSVKTLVAFPQILNRMDEKLDWTEQLGEAFIAQEAQVMDTVQHLRHRAAAAGHLGASEHMRVVRQGDLILIEPADPQIVYVPYYNPVVVYGSWWWPAYPPVHWAPWPGHYVRPGYAPTYLWGSGTVLRIGFFFGHFDWPHRHVIVVHRYPPKVIVHAETRVIRSPHVAPGAKPARWQHDPRHRRGAPFRHVGPRDSRPAQSKPTGDARRPDRIGNTLRPESRSTPRAPALRTDTRPAGAALNGRDQRAQSPKLAPAPATRSAGDRRDAGRPAVTVRKDAPVARPLASRGSSALRVADGQHRAKVPQEDVAARRSASAEKKPVTGGQRGSAIGQYRKSNRRDAKHAEKKSFTAEDAEGAKAARDQKGDEK